MGFLLVSLLPLYLNFFGLHTDYGLLWCRGKKEKKKLKAETSLFKRWDKFGIYWSNNWDILSCFTAVSFMADVARPRAECHCEISYFLPTHQQPDLMGLDLGLNLSVGLEHIIQLLLSWGVPSRSRDSHIAVTVWQENQSLVQWFGGNNVLHITTWSTGMRIWLEVSSSAWIMRVIMIMNKSPRVSQEAVFSFVLWCVYEIHTDVSHTYQFYLLGDHKKINRGMHSDITTLTHSSPGQGWEVLQNVWIEKSPSFLFVGY